jgi:uncharacterized protein (DUF1330 family)
MNGLDEASKGRQDKMSVYAVGRVMIKDPSWTEGYVPAVEAIVKSHGGKYLVRSPEMDVVESNGDAPNLVVIIEFPTKEAAQAFYTSAEYQPWLESRKAGADSELILLDGL